MSDGTNQDVGIERVFFVFDAYRNANNAFEPSVTVTSTVLSSNTETPDRGHRPDRGAEATPAVMCHEARLNNRANNNCLLTNVETLAYNLSRS